MSKNSHESQRRYQRSPAKGLCRIYSSVVPGAMTAKIEDISKGGAFLETKWTPQVNETITCRVLDQKGMEILSTNARVAWTNDRAYQGKVGFGVEFVRTLTDEQEAKVKSMQVNLVEDILSPIRLTSKKKLY